MGFEGSAPVQAPTVAPQWQPDQDKPMRVVVSLTEQDRRSVWVGQRATVSFVPQRFVGAGQLYAALSRLTAVW